MTTTKKVTKQPIKKSENTTTKEIPQSDETKKSPETITKPTLKPDIPSKASRAMIIMEVQRKNIQSDKIKRKDIFHHPTFPNHFHL